MTAIGTDGRPFGSTCLPATIFVLRSSASNLRSSEAGVTGQMSNDVSIESLPNLGPKSSRWLREAGITTVGQLESLGPVVAYRLVKQHQPAASLNLLWALAAGLQGKDWRELTEAERRQLRQEVEDE